MVMRELVLMFYWWSCFLHPGSAALTGLNNCQNWKGDWIEEGEIYRPKKNDLCFECLCNRGHPTMCKTVSCSPPDCPTTLQRIEEKCCEYICIKPPHHPDDTKENGTGYGGDHHPETNVDAVNTTDLGLRLVASTVTSFLVLALLLFMVHRLRQRRMLVMMRRLNAESRSEDDAVAYVSGYDDLQIGIEFPPYEEPPPPYSPPKPPDATHGEAPPPYSEENPGEETGGNNGNNNRNTLNRNHGNVASNTQNATAETGAPANGSLSNEPITEHEHLENDSGGATVRMAPERGNLEATRISDTLQGDGDVLQAQSLEVNSTHEPPVPGAPITDAMMTSCSQQAPEPSQILVSMQNNSPQSTIIRDHSKYRNIKTSKPNEATGIHERLSGSPRAVVIKRSDSIEIKRSSHSPRNSFYLDEDSDLYIGEQVSIHDITPKSQTLPKSHSKAVYHPRNKDLKESDSKGSKHKRRSPKSKRNSTCLTGLGSSPRNNHCQSSVLDSSRNSRLVHDHDNNGILVLCESPVMEKRQFSGSGFRISKALESLPVGSHNSTSNQQTIGDDSSPKVEQNDDDNGENIKLPTSIEMEPTPKPKDKQYKPNECSIPTTMQGDMNLSVPVDKTQVSSNNESPERPGEFSDQGPDTDEEFHSAKGTPATPSMPSLPPVLASIMDKPPMLAIPDLQPNLSGESSPVKVAAENDNQDPETKSDVVSLENDVKLEGNLQGASGDVSGDDSKCDNTANSIQPVRKFKPLTIWNDTSGVDVDKAMSPGECSLARTPVSPSVRPLHARSNSLVSQISVFSVCSETGERKKPKNRQNGQNHNPTNQGHDIVDNANRGTNNVGDLVNGNLCGANNKEDKHLNGGHAASGCASDGNIDLACAPVEHSESQTNDVTLSNDSLYPENHKYMHNSRNNAQDNRDGKISGEALMMIPDSVKRWNIEKSRPVSYRSSLEGDNSASSPPVNRNSSYHDNTNNSNSAKLNSSPHNGARPKQSNRSKTKRKDSSRNNHKDVQNNVIQNNLSKSKNTEKTTSPKWLHSKNINHKIDPKVNAKSQSKFKHYGFIDKVCNNETEEPENAKTITKEQLDISRENEPENIKVKKSKNKSEAGHKKKKSRNSFFSREDHEDQ